MSDRALTAVVASLLGVQPVPFASVADHAADMHEAASILRGQLSARPPVLPFVKVTNCPSTGPGRRRFAPALTSARKDPPSLAHST